MIELVDTHCHIHEAGKAINESSAKEANGDNATRERWLRADVTDPDVMLTEAAEQGVAQVLCVGTTPADSKLAVDFVQSRADAWATIGIHPHDAALHIDSQDTLEAFAGLAKRAKIVAIGECGLDFYYNHSPKVAQERMLRYQIELALKHDLPMVFHVRDAFDDFWRIFDEYEGIRGVVHSFTADTTELDRVLQRGLYVGLNGIMTFTKDEAQLVAARAVPKDKLLLETDAPYLTPAPHRGKICMPKHVRATLEFLAALRGEGAVELAAKTTSNARHLFNLHG